MEYASDEHRRDMARREYRSGRIPLSVAVELLRGYCRIGYLHPSRMPSQD